MVRTVECFVGLRRSSEEGRGTEGGDWCWTICLLRWWVPCLLLMVAVRRKTRERYCLVLLLSTPVHRREQFLDGAVVVLVGCFGSGGGAVMVMRLVVEGRREGWSCVGGWTKQQWRLFCSGEGGGRIPAKPVEEDKKREIIFY